MYIDNEFLKAYDAIMVSENGHKTPDSVLKHLGDTPRTRAAVDNVFKNARVTNFADIIAARIAAGTASPLPPELDEHSIKEGEHPHTSSSEHLQPPSSRSRRLRLFHR